MTYLRRDFAVDLGHQLQLGYDVIRIARWAYEQHADFRRFEPGLEAIILKIIAMEEGTEFEMSEEELAKLVEELKNPGASPDT